MLEDALGVLAVVVVALLGTIAHDLAVENYARTGYRGKAAGDLTCCVTMRREARRSRGAI